MPKPTFHNLPEAKRSAIVAAAVEEFASHPFARASVDRIVDAAGISKGSLYQYFGGKADLYVWLLTEHLPTKKLAALGAAMPDPEASLWTVLETSVLAGVRFAVAEPELTRLGVRFLREPPGDPTVTAVAAAHRAASAAWLDDLLARARARGELRADLDPVAARVFLAHALGEGLLEPLAARIGLTLDAYLDAPHRVGELSDDDLLEVVRGITSLFRDGAASSPATGAAR